MLRRFSLLYERNIPVSDFSFTLVLGRFLLRAAESVANVAALASTVWLSSLWGP